MFLLDFFYRIQLQRKFLMWFSAVASRKVETSVAKTTAHDEKMVYCAYLHAKAAMELVVTTARNVQIKMMLMIIWDL